MKHTVLTHWKLTALKGQLYRTDESGHEYEMPHYQALGLLEGLWQFTAMFAPDGNLTGKEQALVIWLQWIGDGDDLIAALVSAGWLDRAGDRLLVHDWSEHCPKWVIDSRRKTGYEEREKARKAEWNDAQKRKAAQNDAPAAQGGAPGRTSAVTSTSTSTSTSSNTPPSSSNAAHSQKAPPRGPARSKQFKPPTLDEVKAYVDEKGLAMDPAAFVDHFTSNGWKVSGRAAMKCWKSAARNWARRDFGGKPPEKTGKQVATNWGRKLAAKIKAEDPADAAAWKRRQELAKQRLAKENGKP